MERHCFLMYKNNYSIIYQFLGAVIGPHLNSTHFLAVLVNVAPRLNFLQYIYTCLSLLCLSCTTWCTIFYFFGVNWKVKRLNDVRSEVCAREKERKVCSQDRGRMCHLFNVLFLLCISIQSDVNCLEIRHIVYEIQSSTTQTCRLLEQPRK